jgi:hypothetical protein
MVTLVVANYNILIEKQGDLYRVQILDSKGAMVAEEYVEKSVLTSLVWQLV